MYPAQDDQTYYASRPRCPQDIRYILKNYFDCRDKSGKLVIDCEHTVVEISIKVLPKNLRIMGEK